MSLSGASMDAGQDAAYRRALWAYRNDRFIGPPLACDQRPGQVDDDAAEKRG